MLCRLIVFFCYVFSSAPLIDAQLLHACNFDNLVAADNCFSPILTSTASTGVLGASPPTAPYSDVTSSLKPTNNGEVCKLPYQVQSYNWPMYFCNRGYCPTESSANSSCQPGKFGQVLLTDSAKKSFGLKTNSSGVAGVGEQCLVYYYYMPLNGTNTITVVKSEASGSSISIDVVTNASFNGWIQRKVSFTVEARGYRLSFEIQKTTAAFMQIIALDEISISQGTCNEVSTTQASTETSTIQTSTSSQSLTTTLITTTSTSAASTTSQSVDTTTSPSATTVTSTITTTITATSTITTTITTTSTITITTTSTIPTTITTTSTIGSVTSSTTKDLSTATTTTTTSIPISTTITTSAASITATPASSNASTTSTAFQSSDTTTTVQKTSTATDATTVSSTTSSTTTGPISTTTTLSTTSSTTSSLVITTTTTTKQTQTTPISSSTTTNVFLTSTTTTTTWNNSSQTQTTVPGTTTSELATTSTTTVMSRETSSPVASSKQTTTFVNNGDVVSTYEETVPRDKSQIIAMATVIPIVWVAFAVALFWAKKSRRVTDAMGLPLNNWSLGENPPTAYELGTISDA